MRTYKINSEAVKRILQKQSLNMTGKATSQLVVGTVIQTLEAMADAGGTKEAVFVRYGFHAGAVLVDLGHHNDRVVEVTAEGWQILENHPVKFCRPNGMLPLPIPEKGGSLDEFRDLMQIPEDIWPLLLAYIICSTNPRGPYFILMLEGDHGSGKTLLSSFIRQIIDPHSVPAISLPIDARDLMITAAGNWLLNFDNLSSIRGDMSDAFCRLATGGGMVTRQLYTNEDRQIFHSTRPMLMNGITAYASKPDLRDRAIFVHLPALPEEKRLTERALKASFENLQPRIFGAVLDAISFALRYSQEVEVPTSVHMMGAAQWIQAAEHGLGLPEGKLISAIRASQDAKADEFSGLDEIFNKIRDYLCTPERAGIEPRYRFEGTVGQLMFAINSDSVGFATKKLISTPKLFSDYLKRHRKEWLKLGLVVDFSTKGREGRRIRVYLTQEAKDSKETQQIVENQKSCPQP